MWKYATRRVLTMIPILIGVSMVVFLLVASLLRTDRARIFIR